MPGYNYILTLPAGIRIQLKQLITFGVKNTSKIVTHVLFGL